jgi:hypothetical protein
MGPIGPYLYYGTSEGDEMKSPESTVNEMLAVNFPNHGR